MHLKRVASRAFHWACPCRFAVRPPRDFCRPVSNWQFFLLPCKKKEEKTNIKPSVRIPTPGKKQAIGFWVGQPKPKERAGRQAQTRPDQHSSWLRGWAPHPSPVLYNPHPECPLPGFLPRSPLSLSLSLSTRLRSRWSAPILHLFFAPPPPLSPQPYSDAAPRDNSGRAEQTRTKTRGRSRRPIRSRSRGGAPDWIGLDPWIPPRAEGNSAPRSPRFRRRRRA